MSLKIGIPGWTIDRKYFGLTLPYAEFVSRYGTVNILSPDMDVIQDLDLLVLPGGADIAPSRFPESVVPSYYTGLSNPQLEYFDKYKLPEYINIETPILAICRGSQSLWQLFGGQMNQHNYWHKQSEHNKDECHELSWVNNDYEREFGSLITKVNSRHHQTMLGDQVPDELEVLAYAKEKTVVMTDVVEIFRHRTLPIVGYQFHPEDCPNDKLTDKLIYELVTR